MSVMNVTPAMIRPMAMVISISSNVNPRFVVDFINSFEGEKLADRDLVSVQRCQSSEARICRAANRAASLLDRVIDHRREGWVWRQSTIGQYQALAFRFIS